MKKFIVLTGSFNPVTIAHFKILSDAVEEFNADKGFFITTNDKYLTKKMILKSTQPSNFILPENVRGEMLNSLSKDNPKIGYWGTELGGESPNTYKTLLKFVKEKRKQYPNEEIILYYLFGADKLKKLPRWQNIEEMTNFCEYLVYARTFNIDAIINEDPFLNKYRARIHIMNVENDDLVDVSSTEIRRRFFAGEDYRSLMNEGPYEILKKYSPLDFPPLTDYEIIKTTILYGGRFGKNEARLKVFDSNKEIFNSWPSYLGNRDEHLKGEYYDKEFTVNVPTQSTKTQTSCVNSDCVDVAKNLIEEGLNPAILNLASRISPGGGYHKGTSAQEESLCQMSTLSLSLYQFGNPKYKHIRESGVKVNLEKQYPMDLNYGGIYSPNVTFFRNNSNNFYSLRNNPFTCSVISVASLSNRQKNDFTNDEGMYFNANGTLTKDGELIELNKIRTIFRIALDNNHDSIVLGAFGCGVFNLLPSEVSELFKNVLDEPEFKNKFKKVVFAIYERPTRVNPNVGENGKFAPFYEKFN